MESSCYEITRYKLKPGAAADDFGQAIEMLNKRLLSVEGFVDRQVYHSADTGYWVEVVRWTDAESAKKAEENLMSMPECKEIFALLDMDTVSLHHFARVSSFTR